MEVLQRIDRERIAALVARDEFFWLDLEQPTEDEIDELGALLRLPRLAVEDTHEMAQRPKLDDYGDRVLVVFYGEREEGGLLEVHIHVSGQWLVSVRHGACDAFETARATVRGSRSEEEAIYVVLDTLTDSLIPIVEGYDEELDELETAMLARPTDAQRARILTLRNDLLHLRRIVAGQRDMLARRAHLIERLPGLQVDEARDYFRDVHDHLAAISEQVDIGRERLEGALNMYAATVSQRVNDVTARLTLIATIFLPLSVVTGFFGQNFGWLVGHISTWEAFVGYGLGSLVLSGVLLYVYFRRSGFFEA